MFLENAKQSLYVHIDHFFGWKASCIRFKKKKERAQSKQNNTTLSEVQVRDTQTQSKLTHDTLQWL